MRNFDAMKVSLLLLTVWLLSDCTAYRAPSLDDSARQYLRLAVALGERDPDSLDYYFGPSDLVSDVRAHPPPLREIKQSALALSERLKASRAAGSSMPRALFLINQLRAISARADLLLGLHRSFDEEAELFFGIKPPPRENPERLVQIRAEIARLLPGPEPLATRYAAFDQKFVVPPERLPRVIGRALEACRERTIAHLALPSGERVHVEYVNNKPWNAFSYYLGNFQSRIDINTDFALTVDRALQLACHEGYPGHHAFNSLQDAENVRRNGRVELMAQLTFSPQSFVSEAAASVAGELVFPEDSRLAFERDELFPLAGLDKNMAQKYLRIERLVEALESDEVAIARDYLDGKLEFMRASAALEKNALMAHSEATLKYLNEYRSYMLTYTLGKSLAKNCLIENPAVHSTGEDSWHRYRRLILSGVPLRDCSREPAPTGTAAF